MSEERISEQELILPSLYLMSIYPKGINTTNLKNGLREIMKPTGEDLEILNGRKDDKFSQKVRNLKAHNTFERLKVANYTNGIFKINEIGRKHLIDNIDILEYLLDNNFSYNDIKDNLALIENNKEKRKIQVFNENILINEGHRIITNASTFERSKKLRDAAIDHFTHNGKIDCECCSFNFQDFYGKDLGKNLIEIHHIKPIFKYEDEDVNQTIGQALKNLIPVCSNCHRIIHRRDMIPITTVISNIKKYGEFRGYTKN